MTPADELLFLALGGSGEIGMNLNLYGCRGKWVMVDLGITFADPAYPGIDLILPDTAFIEARKDDLLGIVLTHGHEDHIGAVPYLAADLGVPLYATRFTAGLIRSKLDEEGLTSRLKLHVIEEGAQFHLGPFGFRYVPLAHSIPEGNALVIDTPIGRIFHTGDWKLDDAPQLGVPATAEELTAIGDSGVLAMVCDSTNAFNPQASGSEGGVLEGLMETVKAAKARVLVTTFASNAARLQTLGAVARETGRELCVTGRSLDRIISTAKASGYLADFPETIDPISAMKMPRNKVMIIATGGQGEPRAALARVAFGQHDIELSANDTVIFSSRQIPGNEVAIGRIQNALAEAGVLMITEKQAHVHVSGHPGRPELEAMYSWIRPQMLVPVHGEMRHMGEQARLGLASGIPRTIVQKNGDVVRLAPDGPVKIDEVRAGRLVLDGDVILAADGGTMAERRKLMVNGHLSVAFALDRRRAMVGNVTVRAQGIPIESEREKFFADVAAAVEKALEKLARNADMDRLRETVRIAARRVASDWSGKKPVVDVLIVEI